MTLLNQLRKLYTADELRTRQILEDKNVTLASIDAISDDNKIAEFVVKPLLELPPALTLELINDTIACTMVTAMVNNLTQAVAKLCEGHTLVFLQGEDDLCIAVDTRMHQGRGVTEPPTSQVLKGPREGFTEDVKVNLALLRKRLKTSNFRTVNVVVGRYTNTSVTVCYLEGVADSKIVSQLLQRIGAISIDGVLDSNYIASYISGSKSALFKRVGTTEKPDICVGKMLEGRVAIIVDGSPVVLTLPYMFVEDIQSVGDYHNGSVVASVSRILRFVSIIASVLLPAIYVSLQQFNYQIIPIKFLITIANATQAIPLSSVTEMLVVIVIFDILREANLRMPTVVGMSLSLVGAIVLGDAAIKAGLLGAPAVLVGALSGIGLFAMPDNTLVLSVLRLVFAYVGGIMGLYGIILLLMFICGYMVSINEYGTPFLAPFAPSIGQDKQDAIVRLPLDKLKGRPNSIKQNNDSRR